MVRVPDLQHPTKHWVVMTAVVVVALAMSFGLRALQILEFYESLPLAESMRSKHLQTEVWQPMLAWFFASPLIAWLGQRYCFGSLRWPWLLVLHAVAGTTIAAVICAVEPTRSSLVAVTDLPARTGYAITVDGEPLQGLDGLSEQISDVLANLREDLLATPASEFSTSIESGEFQASSRWLIGFRLAGYLALAAIVGGLTFRKTVDSRAQFAAWVESELARTELRALRSQLQPHFLFNALNSVKVLIDLDVYRAKEMVLRLSALLRASLEDVDTPRVPLHREVSVLRDYAAIEGIRFEDRIRITIDVADDLGSILVPPFCLQPLVENALRHGPGAVPEGGSITVSGNRDGNTLILSVVDDGPGLGRNVVPGFGIGNITTRLDRLYGERAQLELESTEPHGCRATIRIELEAADELPAEGAPG